MKTELKFIGIDVSKSTLDICILSDTTESLVIKNTKRSIFKYFGHLLKNTAHEYHICVENTGKYSWELMRILPSMKCSFYVVNPLHLKKSLGLVRGKNDVIDAVRIARFIRKNHDEMDCYIEKRKVLESLQVLMSERKFRVKQRKEIKTKNKEILVLDNAKLVKSILSKNQKLIKELTKQIGTIELELKQLVDSCQRIKNMASQLQSIPGVGPILCLNLIVKTNEFKTIKEARKLACYAGVAPFANTSGISVFGRNKVSNLADKGLKKLLHLGALSAIRLNNDLAIYYHRKVNEGKNKMSVINAVRNKIIHLVFALINNQTFYKNRLATS
ncbi:IS110 family transposase [Maribacter sp. Asnod1-A12]|uniref:IS110 family transposase n=1 Tax=Maribacter sp. Asnod1-A12 TaxID=3160576 RepID=UPI00386F79BA